MCTFLRDSIIDIKVAELKSKPLRMNTTMGAALNFWKRKRIKKQYPDVMVGIQSILESAPHPLGPFGRRLFLEDYMMLEPGNDVIYYISPSHPDFKDSKGNQRLYSEVCTANPLRPMKLKGNIFFAMKLTV